MRTLIVLLLSMFAVNLAHAGVVVWLDQDMPDDRIQKRANVRTGGTRHVAGWDVMFPPMPAADADQAAIEALADTISDGKRRWNEFEVEYGIAQAVEAALDDVDVIRSERDLAEIVEALLFQGAAVQVAFEPEEFRDGERAEPFRIDRTGGAANRPWGDALALYPERDPLPSDVADGATFPILQNDVPFYRDLPEGTLVLPPRGPGDVFVVDGSPLASDVEQVELLPGRHFVHLMRNKKIAGRRVVRVESGRETAVEPYVSREQLEKARERVLSDTTTGFPDAVRASLERLSTQYGGSVFVAAHDDNKVVVLPWGHGAELLKQRKVTLVGAGELGGVVLSSSVFDEAQGRNVFAPGVEGSLGFELGIYNAVLLAGADLALTPGKTITYANGEGTDNVDTSTFAHPYAGLGAYLLRPTGRRATLLIAGHYAWLYPAHHGFGGRFSLGVPFEAEGGTWLRFTAGATTSGDTSWGTGQPMVAAFLRAGLAARF